MADIHAMNSGSAAGRLNGKVAIITGGAQGFGLGIAREMIREGARVLLADLNGELAEKAALELGPRAAGARADVSDEKMVEQMVAEAVTRFGRLDILVSNAGILKAGSLDDMTAADFDLVTRINYKAFFLCAKYASKVMKAQTAAEPGAWCDIIQINSKSGLEGSKNNFAYAGSKFGSIGLVQSFALELAPYRIKVNAICPGNYYDGPLWSDPERGLFVQYLNAGKVPGAKTVQDVKDFYLAKSPIRRGCFPEDVAKAVFYCVEQCYETGQAIPVTGGQVMMN
jgi:sorbitol-6-phosphate 2-dehydrogenase